MEFIIDRVDVLNISDKEIFNLLSSAYVGGGFTSPEVAKEIFNPVKVRHRGVLFASREAEKNKFSGMVIVVPPESDAVVRARANECEMHLLAVAPEYRGHGLGRELVKKAFEFASAGDWVRMILWTQKRMKEAQRLYESLGFNRVDEMEKNGIEFFVYERICA